MPTTPDKMKEVQTNSLLQLVKQACLDAAFNRLQVAE